MRPHVLLAIDSLDVGGAERHVVGLGSALVRREYDVTLACAAGGALRAAAEAAGITVCVVGRHPVKRRFDIGYALGLVGILRHTAVDVVHAHLYASATAAAAAVAGTRIPLLVTEHSQADWRSRWARWCSRRAYARAGRVIAVSHAIARRLREEDKVGPEKIVVLPNALIPPYEAGLQWHDEPVLGMGPRIGVVARLQPEKGVACFLDAAAVVLRQAPTARFLIVGDGPERAALQDRAARLGLDAATAFLGFRLDAPSLIGTLDVLAIPSFSEGTPLVALEAMAAGVPVVASAVGGIPDQVRHGQEGFLVPAGDPDALAAAILRLVANSGLRRRFSAAGRERVRSLYSLAAMTAATEAVYRGVMRQPRAPSPAEEPLVPSAP
jgi:glycosyltransferase involved in cell wall biosynthesis